MIDKSKQYRTRDGREVRIYATDGVGSHSVHGAIKDLNGWRHAIWMPDGHWSSVDMGSDLIEVKPRIKREVWVNVYPEESGMNTHAHECKKAANDCAGPSRIACVKLTIDCAEGEGL